MGCSPARPWPGPKVPVMGVWGKPVDFGKPAVFGPSEGLGVLAPKPDAKEIAFLWLDRKALADGGGRGLTSWGGVAVILGGDREWAESTLDGVSAGGGDT